MLFDADGRPRMTMSRTQLVRTAYSYLATSRRCHVRWHLHLGVDGGHWQGRLVVCYLMTAAYVLVRVLVLQTSVDPQLTSDRQLDFVMAVAGEQTACASESN